MYSPLNESYMFQAMEDRVARIQVHRSRSDGHQDGGNEDRQPNRHWWNRSRLAR